MWLIIAASTILALLGGAYFPLELAPTVIQQVAQVSPMFWLSEGILRVQDDNAVGWLACAGVLMAFAVLCFVVAGRKFSGRRSVS